MMIAFTELASRVPRTARILAGEVAAVGLALGTVLMSEQAGFWWSRPAAVVACLALPLRLRWPWLALLCCLIGLSGELGLAPALVGLYRIGRTARSPLMTMGWAVAAMVATEVTVFAINPMTPQDATLSVLFTALWMIAPSALGMLVSTRQKLAASLAELSLAREAELEARAERARAQERARIGQEIHDAVGHHATLIAVEAAALAATTAEPETKATAQHLRALAKASLAEMRVALGLSNGPKETTGRGWSDVPELVNRATAAGVPIDFDDTDAIGANVESVVGRAAFRIIQEGLTNAAKYAPTGQVRVKLGREGAKLTVTITSDLPQPTPTDFEPGGMGITGMAERASTVGGHLTVDQDGDLFTVRAHLPLKSHAPSKVEPIEPTNDGTESALGVG